jgi:hypothetical protein
MTATNKRYSYPSHDDSNQCTPSRGKPDQHATRILCSVHVCLSTIRILRGLRIATFHETPIELDRVTTPEKQGSRLHPQHVGLTDLWVPTQFSSHSQQKK